MSDSEWQNDNDKPSKSQRKRDMLAKQALGERLVAIDPAVLEKCDLPEFLREAIDHYKRLPNKHEARRRQLQFIGRLMRDVDTDHIQAVLHREDQLVTMEQRRFRRLETIRDNLVAGDQAALEELIESGQGLDIQHVRQLIRQAQKERAREQAPAAARKLFRYLREAGIDEPE